MNELFIPLRITPGITGIYLKPVCGTDEIAVEDTGTGTAIGLLEGLMASGKGKNGVNNFNVAKIVTADRDRILAHLYTTIYGSKVESILNCENCEKPFDLDFSLTDLLNHYQLSSALQAEDGTYQIETGISFRLPTGEDEMMLAGFSPTDAEVLLMTKCLVKGDLQKDSTSVQQKMDEIAPVLNMELQAGCPECGHLQQVQFDIQTFLLMKLKQERPHLIREIHSIAINYHWAPDAILGLPRNLRKQYVALIESDN